MASEDVTDIVVSRRILWIGSEAYPLRNIARVQMITLSPRRSVGVGRLFKAALLAVLVYVAGTMLVGSSSSDEARLIVVVLALAVLVYGVVALIRVLLLPQYFELRIETAGSPHTAVVSKERRTVLQLVHQITEAIENPQANFKIRVKNFRIGDEFKVFGQHNVGRVG